jgi:hypothetical protein
VWAATRLRPIGWTCPRTCHPTPNKDTIRLAQTRCGQVHRVEVIGYVDAEGDETSCRLLAERFLGGPLDGVRVVTVMLTSSVAKVYPCGLAEVGDTAGHVVERRGSLRDALRDGAGSGPSLAITCVFRAEASGEALMYVDCGGPHVGELVGVVADDGQPEANCAAAAESYIGDGFRMRKDLRLMWITGGHRVRCFAVDPTGDNALHATIKGLGSAALPR